MLELLALGEVIARKAVYGRQLAVRTARAAGAFRSQWLPLYFAAVLAAREALTKFGVGL